MKFHLQFPISPSPEKFNYSHSSLLLGSCFAENVGEDMSKYKLNTLINPNGILFNPSSIAVALKRYFNCDLMKEAELFFANEVWNSWEHHSRFSHPDKQACLNTINKHISEAHLYLKNTNWLFITFGSAFVYKRNNSVVGNCHKQAQKEFVKEMLKVEQIVTEYQGLIEQLKELNPDLKIVLTLSPVRYVRDGVVENNLSKAVLLLAIHQLVKQSSNVFYFPAYELVIDDLRDYRFFEKDLVHPNQQAIEYIFQKWKAVFFDDQSLSLFEKVKDIVAAAEHRPFQIDSQEYKKFKSLYLQRCEDLKKEFSFLDLTKELKHFAE